MAVDAVGNLYLSDTYNQAIRMVPKNNGTYFGRAMTANFIYTIAGSPLGLYRLHRDGGAATSALLWFPGGITMDSSSNLYIADYGNNRIQMVPQTSGPYFNQAMTANFIYTVAGSSLGINGYSGDSGAAINASLNGPASIAIYSSGNLYIADSANNIIRQVLK